jgi:hypothetical protein
VPVSGRRALKVNLMARAKKSQPRERLFQWRVTLIKGTPAKYLGYVSAPDEETARKEAAKEFKVSEVLRDRIAVQREG